MFGILGAVGSCAKGGGDAPTPSDGWTVFEPQPDARIVYVADVAHGGSDANDGLSPDTPKATIAAGYALLRNGEPDWLLLRRGSTWDVSTLVWNKSGPLADNAGWMLFSYYGDIADPRPVVNTDVDNGMVVTPGFAASAPIAHFAMTDIFLTANGRLASPETAPPDINGLVFVAVEYGGAGAPFQHIVLENNYVTGYNFGVVGGNDLEDVKVRRNIFTEIFSPGGSGVNASGVLMHPQGYLLEENVFYRIQYPTMPAVSGVSFFSHSAYIGADASDVVTRSNIIIQATEGLMQRPGGVYTRNAVTDTAIAGLMGQATGVTPTPGGVETNMVDNVWLNVGGTFQIGNTHSGAVDRNVMVRGPEGSASYGIELIGVNASANIGVHDVTFEDNFLAGDFTRSPNPGDSSDYSGLVFTDNTVNVGAITETLAAFLDNALGLGPGGDSDTWGQFLRTRDRANYSTAMEAEVFLNYYRGVFGLPTLD